MLSANGRIYRRSLEKVLYLFYSAKATFISPLWSAMYILPLITASNKVSSGIGGSD